MAALTAALLLLAHSEVVRLTYYTLPGYMANGNRVHLGAAACSKWMPLGQRLKLPDGFEVTCEDRGDGDRYWGAWVDVWAPSRSWGASRITGTYGDYALVEFLEEEASENDQDLWPAGYR